MLNVIETQLDKIIESVSTGDKSLARVLIIPVDSTGTLVSRAGLSVIRTNRTASRLIKQVHDLEVGKFLYAYDPVTNITIVFMVVISIYKNHKLLRRDAIDLGTYVEVFTNTVNELRNIEPNAVITHIRTDQVSAIQGGRSFSLKLVQTCKSLGVVLQIQDKSIYLVSPDQYSITYYGTKVNLMEPYVEPNRHYDWN